MSQISKIKSMRKSDIMVQISYKEGTPPYSEMKKMSKKELIHIYEDANKI